MPISKEDFVRIQVDRLEPVVHNALVFLRQHPDKAFTVKELMDKGVLAHDRILDFYRYAMVTDVLDYATIASEGYFIIKVKGDP